MSLTRNVVATLFAVAVLSTIPPLGAQEKVRDGEPVSGAVPKEVARDVTDRWNAADTRRVRGPFTLAASDTLRGDLAVIDGPVKIAGVVIGQVVAINADVTLDSTGRINGNLTVVGGAVIGRSTNSVKGNVLNWRAQLRYTEENEHIAPAVGTPDYARLQRWRRNREVEGAFGDFFAASAHTYNRVEGLPLILGPRLRTRHGDTRATVELYGIFRTGDQLAFKPSNLGHLVRAEVKQGKNAGYFAGARLYDEVAPVESWALTDLEVGLGSALFTRDFRDYYQRHGGKGYVGLFGPAATTLTVSLGRERWDSRATENPWSLFQSADKWRPNPRADEGVVNLLTVTGQLDTRNDVDRASSGWLLSAEYERGSGSLISVAPTTVGTRTTSPGDITYGRALLDLRRYNRLAPNTQLNVRMVAGGVLAGDQLPLQRRFSVSGADALPGYDFRSKTGTTDVGSCASGSDSVFTQLGRPAQCDRFMLLQAEWKTDFHFSFFRDGWRPFNRHLRVDGSWVLFSNTGRGWLVGEGESGLHYGKASLPALGTWRTDIGGGLDFGSFGVYIAQSVSDTDLRPNVFLRLGRRF